MRNQSLHSCTCIEYVLGLKGIVHQKQIIIYSPADHSKLVRLETQKKIYIRCLLEMCLLCVCLCFQTIKNNGVGVVLNPMTFNL